MLRPALRLLGLSFGFRAIKGIRSERRGGDALRRPTLVAIISYGGVLLNIVLDLAYVGGFWGLPQMGAEGVAIATTGSRYAIAVAMFVAVIFLTPAFRASPKAEPGEAKRQFEVGIG